jgi:dTDP-4-amino-4,6-dideoxygalactose transaminase
VRSIQASDPQQARRAYFARVCRHAGLKLATWPPLFTLLVRGCERLGRDHDDLLRGAVRGFGGGNDGDATPLIRALRHRPSYPLLALLARRLREVGTARVARRVVVAEDVLARLRGMIDRPGTAAPMHAHWVLPVYTPDPDALVLRLRRRGFDATRRGSALCVIDAPPDQPDADAPQARAAMSRMVFLPLSATMTARDARGLAEAVADAVRADAPTETPTVLAPWAS